MFLWFDIHTEKRVAVSFIVVLTLDFWLVMSVVALSLRYYVHLLILLTTVKKWSEELSWFLTLKLSQRECLVRVIRPRHVVTQGSTAGYVLPLESLVTPQERIYNHEMPTCSREEVMSAVALLLMWRSEMKICLDSWLLNHVKGHDSL